MEGEGKHVAGARKGLLNAIAVVSVNVYVEHPRKAVK